MKNFAVALLLVCLPLAAQDPAEWTIQEAVSLLKCRLIYRDSRGAVVDAKPWQPSCDALLFVAATAPVMEIKVRGKLVRVRVSVEARALLEGGR